MITVLDELQNQYFMYKQRIDYVVTAFFYLDRGYM